MVVYLHAGLPKTGSTAIQQACFHNRHLLRARGYDYWSIYVQHAGGLLHALDGNASVRRSLAKGLSSAPNFIISAEQFSSFTECQVGGVHELVGPVTVIAYIREPRGWYSSAAAQAVQAGRTLDGIVKVLRAGFYKLRMSGLEYCPDVIFRPYSLDVLADFLCLIGVGDLELPYELRNERYSSNAINAMAVMNQRNEKFDPSVMNLPGPPYVLPKDVIDSLLVECAEDIRYASEKLGIDLLSMPDTSGY